VTSAAVGSGTGGNGKAALRRRVLSARAGLSAQQRAAAGQALRDAVLGLPQAQMAGTAAVYYSIGSEPGTHGLVYALWKRGTYVLLPVLRPDMDLDWASYEGPESLRAGPRGLTEPAEPPRGVSAVSRADLVIVPALAVDRRAAATTARWPGWARRSRRSRSCMTPSCSTRCPPPLTTSGYGSWRAPKRE